VILMHQYHLDRVLAIETSAEACSVALAIGATVRERHQHAPLKHAELLLASIRALLDEADLGLGALDAIVFGRGPGGFTSLRIGIGAVQGLAWGAGLPVVPVSSLAAVAQQVEGAGAAEILVAMDARMDEVFSALFAAGEDGGLLSGEERVGAPEALSVERPGETIGCGNGFDFHQKIRVGKASNDEIGCRGGVPLKPLIAQGPIYRQGLRAGLGYEHGQLNNIALGHPSGFQYLVNIGEDLLHLRLEALPD